MAYEFLNDRPFLKQIDCLRIKQQSVKITILSWNEEPIEEIQGRVTSGSLSISGQSSLRRTGSLTLQVSDRDNDFQKIQYLLNINKKVKLELGIKNTVPKYIYNTLDGDKQVDYQQKYGNMIWFPLGIFVIFDPNISHGTGGFTVSVSLKDKMCLLNGDAGGTLPAAVTFHELEETDENGETVIKNPTISQIILEAVNHFGNESLAKIIIEDIPQRIKAVSMWHGSSSLYYIQLGEQHTYSLNKPSTNGYRTFEYGDSIGYIMTDFTYPGQLVSNPGDTITSVLDNIVNALGNYEYFYDVFGNFHFQEIKNYLNTSYTKTVINEAVKNDGSPAYAIDLSRDQSVYTFDGTTIISTITDAKQYTNVKNDFIVWGKHNNTNSQLPLRYHLAIDTKPRWQKIDNIQCYGKHEHIQFKTDSFNNVYAVQVLNGGQTIYSKDWREELYYQGIEATDTGSNYNYYYTELVSEWPKLYDLQHHKFKGVIHNNPSQLDFYLDLIDDRSAIGQYSVNNIGRRSIVESNDKINCIFEDDIPDVVIINNENPDEVVAIREECEASKQDWTQVEDNIFNSIVMGGMQNSAFNRINELLYQYTNMNDTINITCLPIYYLEPNTRITVNDPKANIMGDYIISSITIPLDTSSSAQISAYVAQSKL